MSNKNLTEIVFILDKSGSMSSIKDDTIGGFNSFIDEQKKVPGEAIVTLILFDHDYQIVYTGVPINNVQKLTAETFIPGGNTALNDAIARTIIFTERNINLTCENLKPGKVMIAILTDGQENYSKEYRERSKINEMITKKRNDGWEFAFLAANQDAFKEAESFGISKGMTANFMPTADGVRSAYKDTSMFTTNYRNK